MTTPAGDLPNHAAPTPSAGGRGLVLLLLVALLFKLVTVLASLGSDPLATDLTSDARYYVERAAGLAGRFDDPLADEPYHLPPLYPALLSLLPGVPDGDPTWALVLQALAGVAALFGVHRLARRRMSPTAALIAPALMLLYAPLGFFETRLLGDSLACAGLIGLLCLGDALTLAVTPRRRLLLCAGLGLGTALTALLRPQMLLLGPLLALWVLRRRDGPVAGRASQAALLLFALALGLLPSTLHNWRASGDLIPISDNGGVNLWLANTGPVSGTFRTFRFDFGDIAGQATAARAVAQAAAGRALSAGEVSSELTALGLDHIRSDPGEFASRVGWRALALLEDFETGVVFVPQVHMGSVPPLAAAPLSFGVLLGLFTAAACLGAFRNLCRRGPCGPMLALSAVVLVTTLVFFHYSRFRLPLIPLMALGVAAGWDQWHTRRPTALRLGLALAAGLAAFAVSVVPAPHHADALANGHTQLGESWQRRGQADGDPALLEAALLEAEAALAVRPGYVKAELLAVRAALLLGRFDLCNEHLDLLEQHLPGDVPTRIERALLLALPHPDNTQRDPERARRLLDELRLLTLDTAQHQRLDMIERMLAADR